MAEKGIDQFFELFLQESRDRFEELGRQLVQLEKDPADEELLYAILRNVHSLKGSAGMFGCEDMKVIGHRLEDLVELAHAKPEIVNREVMDLLFEGCDILQAVLQRFTGGGKGGEASAPREHAFLEHLETVIDKCSTGGGDIVNAVEGLMAELDRLLPTMGEVWDVKDLQAKLEQVRRMGRAQETFQEADVSADEEAWIGRHEVSEPLRRLERLLGEARQIPLSDSDAAQALADMGALLDAAEALELPSLKETLEEGRDAIRLFADRELEFDALQGAFHLELLKRLRPHVSASPAGAPDETTPSGQDETLRVPHPAHKTVRVDEAKIDAFLNRIGELIILSEVFNNLQKQLDRSGGEPFLMREFKAANAGLAAHVYALQSALMEVRRIELRNATGSLARLVRDTARQLGKEVDFVLQGADAVLDKNLLDGVKTCLVHLVRNAVDHGIEPAHERRAAGKPAAGRLEVIAGNENGLLVLKVRDDGRGLDEDRLRQRAVAQGLLSSSAARELTRDQVVQLVFSDGLSTAERVSDISGRGVGMGVVLESIRNLDGSIEVSSEPGAGTEVTVRVPLKVMLSVVDGLVVRVGDSRFILPIQYVKETFRPQREQVSRLQGRGECILLRGRVYTLKHLRRLFDFESEDRPVDLGVGVLVRKDRREFCLLADQILDHQQVVIKDIDGLGNIPGIRGGALLGDGSVGLVLNLDTLPA